MPTSLPSEFADLEPFSDWCLRTEAQRYAKRLSSSMDEMQAFYDAAFPRLEEILTYLDRLDLGALPPEDAEMLIHDPPFVVLASAVQLMPEISSDCSTGLAPPATPWKLSAAGDTVKCGATQGESATWMLTVCCAGSAPSA